MDALTPGTPERLYPERRHPAHGVFGEANAPVILFITACTRDRLSWLCTDRVHHQLRASWQEASAWIIGRYILMPDHLHLFAAPMDEAVSVETWVQFWKSTFSRRCETPEWRWQSGCWDRRLRTRESYEQKWEYVRENPVRRGLVKSSETWPYQGELNVLPW